VKTVKIIQIEILKADRPNEYVMFRAIDAVDVTRGSATDGHRETFRERTAPGAPPAIRQWFVPGRASGWEFVYPSK
jgi:hypothetical protein